MKKILGKYKLKNTENFGNFSYNKRNYDLIRHSNIQTYGNTVRNFRKKIKNLEDNLNKKLIKRKNIRHLFLDKIINFEPEELNKNFQSLFERRYNRIDNNKDNFNKLFFNYKGFK